MRRVRSGVAPYTSRVVRLAVRGRERQYRQSHDTGRKSPTAAACRTGIADFPIRGYEYYDYRHDVVNTTFVNYAAQRASRCGRAVLPAVHQLRHEHREHGRGRDIRQRQAGQLPADPTPLVVRFRTAVPPTGARRSMTWTARSAEFPVPTSSSTTASPRHEEACEIRASWNAADLRWRHGPLQHRRYAPVPRVRDRPRHRSGRSPTQREAVRI